MTAVGKVYKPRLRVLACEHVLRDRLGRAGLQDAVDVVVDGARGLAARFVSQAGEGP